MTRRWLSFDIEISKVLPEETTDWEAHMPLGISCMATYEQGSVGPTVWFGSGDTMPLSMSKDDLIRFIHYLHMAVADGYTILTWNGLSFDWHQLAVESGLHEECCRLATDHCDLMFQIYCLKGFPLGLDTVAKGLGLPGKPEGMSGEKAPVLWQQGDYDTVLQYVAQDVKSTLEVALEIEKRGGLSWISKSGRQNRLSIPKLLTVAECLKIEEPDVSWMDSPIPRSKFVGWMEKTTAQ